MHSHTQLTTQNVPIHSFTHPHTNPPTRTHPHPYPPTHLLYPPTTTHSFTHPNTYPTHVPIHTRTNPPTYYTQPYTYPPTHLLFQLLKYLLTYSLHVNQKFTLFCPLIHSSVFWLADRLTDGLTGLLTASLAACLTD